MLEIKNLVKVFRSKSDEECIALDDVSFSLDNKGFVFVVGKSGSGKTTLLSLIGALDNITSGDIIVDNQSIKNLNNKDFAYYRNSKIGFVFQDYHLIEEMTIFDNVNIALKLQHKKDNEKVKEALKEVGLEGFENRYPKELSGGQKQRVAIARSIVKNPSIILADEPTGNLDEKTTTQILSLLKEISKKHLVLIVSHDIIEARKYADRIIELKSGKITNNLIRNPNYNNKIEVKDQKLFLPLHKELTKEEQEFIDEKLNKGEIKDLVQKDNKFIEASTDVCAKPNDIKIEKKHLSFINNIKIGWKFLKKHLVRINVYSVVISLLILVMSLAQLLAIFNPTKVIKNELENNNQTTLALRKTFYDTGIEKIQPYYSFSVGEHDKEAIINTGYKGHIYDIVEAALGIVDPSYMSAHFRGNFNPLSIYEVSTYGTVVTDEEFVNKCFNFEGHFEDHLVAKAPVQEPFGFFITDYSADSIRNNYRSLCPTYESILGYIKLKEPSPNAYINGIIKTDYIKKHKNAINKLTNSIKIDTTLAQDKEIVSFVNDVNQFYTMTYTFNKNFREDYINSPLRRYVFKRGISAGVDKDNLRDFDELYQLGELHVNLQSYIPFPEEGEAIVDYNLYNAIFKTDYDNVNFVDYNDDKTMHFRFYNQADPYKKNAFYEFTLKVKKLCPIRGVYIHHDLYNKCLDKETFITGYYLDDLSNVGDVFNATEPLGFMPVNSVAYPVTSMTRVVKSFSSLPLL